MKAKLIFKIPKEQKAFLAAAKTSDLTNALWEITYNLRKRVEWFYDAMPEGEYDKLRPIDGVEKVMDEITSILNKGGIDIDDLTE
jgi:hypothetical protein